MTPRKTVLAAIAVAGLAIPSGAAAKAKTKTVYLGPPPAVSQALGKATNDVPADVNAFFPGSVTIHPGDKVKFIPSGFHNVEIPAKGKKPAQLILPTGHNANETDAAGAPFWFNGQPLVGFNPGLVTVNLFNGKTTSFKASKGFETGLPLQDKPKPATLTFKKKGQYTFYCSVHAGMKGTVTVKKGKIPSAKADLKAVAKQGESAVTVAQALLTKPRVEGTMALGDAGKGGVELFAFLPQSLNVSKGTTVIFPMPAGSLELHTATTGPGDINDATSYIGKLAAGFEAPEIPGAAVYPSDSPATPGGASLTPTLHGNGFWNSGALDSVAASPQPDKAGVRFDAPGTYTFYCLVHPFMVGTVTVQ